MTSSSRWLDDVGMAAPRVTAVPPGTFHRWLAARDQLGDQHKVPRASNHRDVIEAVLAVVGAPAGGSGVPLTLRYAPTLRGSGS